MKYEFHAQFPLALQDSGTQAFAIEWLVEKSGRLPPRWKELSAIQDPLQRIALLAQAIVTPYKEQARTGTRRDSSGLKFWLEKGVQDFLSEQSKWLKAMGLTTSLPDLSALPLGSWAIQVPFTLRKPYISKDDTDFYILDNPVKKEWIFKVPYVASSQWKGALRAAMVRNLAVWWQGLHTTSRRKRHYRKAFVRHRLQLARLFGNEKRVAVDDQKFEAYLDRVGGDDLSLWYRRAFRCLYTRTGFLAGRLYFYPTYFNRIGLEVINPHDRKTGAGKQPIYFECVPAGTPGVFTLLYVPLDLTDVPEDERRRQAEEDLALVAQGVRAMLNVYGFGAKTSSGYGVTEVVPEDITVRPHTLRDIWLKAWRETHG